MRSIAADAGVDVALVSYYFGSKRALFGAAMQLVTNPAQVVAEALPGDLDTLPERLLRRLVQTWDDPKAGAPLRALVSGIGQDPAAAKLFREVIEREIIAPIAQRLGGGRDAELRAARLAVPMAGLVYARYVLRLEPLASLPPDDVVSLLAPVVGRALSAG